MKWGVEGDGGGGGGGGSVISLFTRFGTANTAIHFWLFLSQSCAPKRQQQQQKHTTTLNYQSGLADWGCGRGGWGGGGGTIFQLLGKDRNTCNYSLLLLNYSARKKTIYSERERKRDRDRERQRERERGWGWGGEGGPFSQRRGL